MYWKCLVLCVVFGLSIATSLYEVQAQELDINNVDKKTQRVQFTDGDGKAIQGVVVRPFGLNSSYFWPEAIMGKAKEYTSDSDGFVAIEYPSLFADSVMCQSIDFITQHVSHVGTVERLKVVDPEDAKVVLKKGIKMRVAAVDEDGKLVTEKYAALFSGDSAPEFWNRLDDGSIQTESIATGNCQVMLVQPMENGKTRFSDPLFYHFVDADLEEPVDIDDVELVEGVRIFGEFPSHIPRPIQNGLVMAVQFPLPLQDAQAAQMPLLSWADWVEVDADGTFEFKSMPRSGQVQLIALCDGWVSTGKSIITEGQQFKIQDDDLEVDLELVRTMKATITVRDRDRKPISDASIACNPNQMWKYWGSQILGERNKTMVGVQSRLSKQTADVPSFGSAFEKFMTKTDEDGVGRILNIPIYFAGRQLSIYKKGYKSIEKELKSEDIVDSENLEVQPTVDIEIVLDIGDPE